MTHHLLWFPPNERSARMVVPADWGPQLVAALAPAFDAVFGLDLSDQGDEPDLDPIPEVQDVFARELARVPPLLRLSGPAVMVYVLLHPIGPIETKLFELPRVAPPSPYTRTRALLVWAAVFAALMIVGLLIRRAS
nr:hypothetical protein [Deltaproteobacteria bacterium]